MHQLICSQHVLLLSTNKSSGWGEPVLCEAIISWWIPSQKVNSTQCLHLFRTSVTISINWKCTWSLDYRNGNYWVWGKWQDPMVWVFVISLEELIAFTLKIWPPGMVPQCLIDLVFPWSLLFMLFLWKQKQQLLLSLLWEQPKPQQDTPEPETVGKVDLRAVQRISWWCIFACFLPEKSQKLCVTFPFLNLFTPMEPFTSSLDFHCFNNVGYYLNNIHSCFLE